MHKLTSYAISFIIAAAVLYFLSFIFVAVFAVVFLIVKFFINYFERNKRFTEWELEGKKLSVFYENKEKYVRRVNSFKRYDNYLNVWELKEEVKIMTKNNLINPEETLDFFKNTPTSYTNLI